MVEPRHNNIFSILIGFVIFGLVFFILKAEIDQSLEILFTSYMSEYKSVISLLLLLVIMIVLLLLAITCTYSRFLHMLGVSDQVELQRNQIFFNLIQLSIDNLMETNEEFPPTDPSLEANPPDYNSVVIETGHNHVNPKQIEQATESETESCLEPPPSYEVALARSLEQRKGYLAERGTEHVATSKNSLLGFASEGAECGGLRNVVSESCISTAINACQKERGVCSLREIGGADLMSSVAVANLC